MDLTLIRKQQTDKSTIGDLAVNGNHECFTLEPAKPIIPVGLYFLDFYYSPKHDYSVPLVRSVPNHDGVEIHPGNYPADTLGCILVGRSRGPDEIMDSNIAFIHLVLKHLVPAWMRKELIRITVKEDFNA